MSESKVQIILSGDENFDPDVFTKMINITPEAVWKIGDKIGSSIRTRNENSWVLSTEYSEDHDVPELLEKILDKMAPVEKLIIDYLQNTKNVEMQASIAIYAADEFPALNFNPDLITRLESFKASLDIDVILIE